MTTNTYPPVPFDLELIGALDLMESGVIPALPVSHENLPAARARASAMSRPVAEAVQGLEVVHEEHVIAGPQGSIEISVLKPRGLTHPVPAVFNMHGGGLVVGDRFMNTTGLAFTVLRYGVIGINVEYRLAPEFPDSGPSEDCYAALLWIAEHSHQLGLDPARIIVSGGSAGGNLAASMALLARDRNGPKLLGQLLMSPMLDDRNTSVSSYQYAERPKGVWNRSSNVFAWSAILGDRVGTEHVSPYVAPARATDLSNLPPAFIEVGSAEVFRDEAVEYATKIWATGGEAELHVWNGAFHNFATFCPDSRLAVASNDARDSWLRRLLKQD